MHTVVALGHSHLGALERAYKEINVSGTSPIKLVSYQFLRRERPHIINQENRWQYHPEIRDEIIQLLDIQCPDSVIMMLQGEQAVAAGLLTPETPYEFFFPDEDNY